MAEKTANHLNDEKSPYLRQHAYNPVQWYPWSEEAFIEAKKQNKPIFLSIGYSACHWCHVMEKESFADAEIGQLMNEMFVSIKVDREERPDIDDYYMAVCQLLTGSGGWPLTIFMTPDKKPFFAGTYFPKESRFGLTGLKDLLSRVGDAWARRPLDLLSSAQRIGDALIEAARPSSPQQVPPDILESADKQLVSQFDEDNGGFGSAPKFPTFHHLTFLLRYARRANDARALEMVEKTLQTMRLGGIWDHLGFGFHRYSTDARWLIPHFEKMLYDQALLAMAYAEAYQLTARDEYGQTVEEILTYVLRDMTSEEGGFFTAEDADSEGEEGRYYLWKEREVRSLLPPEEAELAIVAFGIRPAGNFVEAGSHGHEKNILHFSQPLLRLAANSGIPADRIKKLLAAIRHRLLEAREKRPKPFKDKKILTDWNGLMIASLAKASQALGREDYSASAKKAADFIHARMTRDKKLYHRYAEGELAIRALLDDYAFLIWGLLELYETIFEGSFLEWASQLAEETLRNFWDEKGGGFFLTSKQSQDLPSRRKDIHDGALPSGNSAMTLNLIRLARLVGRPEFEEKAARMVEAFSGRITQMPMAHTHLMSALDFARGPSYEVVIAGRPNSPDTRAMIRALHKEFIPNKIVLFRPEGIDAAEIARLAPYVEPMTAIGGRATAYVCSNFRCQLPTTEPEVMLSLLKKS